MINLRVRNLKAKAAQPRTAGSAVAIAPARYPNGRCARRHDPEGTPIER